jgi:hypothetical protein
MQRSNLKFIILCISCLVHNTVISISQNISPKQIALVQNKYLRDKFVDEHHIDHYVHIPASVKEAVIECVTAYPELKSFINLSMFTQDTQHIISQEQASTITQELIALLKESPLKTSNPIDTTLTTLEQYLRDIESGKLHVASDPLLENIPLSPSGTRASQHLYNTNTGLAIAGGGILNISGVSNIGTQGSGNTVTISLNSTLSLSGPLILTTFGPGVLTSSSTGVISSSPTTNNAVQIGNATGTLTSIPVGSNGQVLIGATGAAPAFASLTSNLNTILYSSGPNSLNLDVNTNFPVNLNISGNLSVAGNLNVTGTANLAGGLNVTGPVDFHSLTGPGAVTVSSTGLLGSAQATNNGQILLGVSGGLPFFTGLSSPINPSGASSIIYSSGANFLTLQSVPLFANVIRVDWLNGNNATATVTNGLPYKTITAAMNAISSSAIASSVNPVVVWVMPGIYNETVTMQSYVSLIGMSQGAGAEGSPVAGVTIQQLNVTSNTTLVSMADNSRLENVILNLTCASATPTTLAGIAFTSGASSVTASVKNVTLAVNATNIAASGNIYGVNVTSTGVPTQEFPALSNCNIYITSSASANIPTLVTALYVSTGATNQGITLNNCSMTIALTGSTIPTSSGAVTMNEGTCYISGGTMVANNTSSSMSSSNALYGIAMLSSSVACTINNCPLSVFSSAGAPACYGLQSSGGVNATITMNSCPITVTSSGSGTPIYGIFTSTNALTINQSAIQSTLSAGTSTSYAASFGSTAVATFNNCSLNGTNTNTPASGADLNSSASPSSNVKLYNTMLVNANANNTNFTCAPSSLLTWSTNAISTAGTQVLLFGGGSGGGASYGNAYITLQRPAVFKNLYVQNNGSLPAGPKTFQLFQGLPGSGSATALTTTIAQNGTSGTDTTHSVAGAIGQTFYMQMTGTGTPFPFVTVEMY